MQWFPLVLYLLVSVTSNCAINATNSGKTCPPPDIIEPCTCREDMAFSGTISVYCTNLNSPKTLEDVFARMPNWRFRGLSLVNSSMPYIPSSIFLNASFVEFNVIDSTFTNLFDKPPSSESLIEFYTNNVTFQREVDWRMFSKLRVQIIALNGAVINTLGESFHDSVPETLETLVLGYSNITSISPRVFMKAKKLWAIDISKGLLKKLDYDVLPLSIINIRLDHHLIQTLPEGIFDGLPKLYSVSLAGNVFTTIQEEVFSTLKINILFFADNKIKCDCSLHWITKWKTYVDNTICVYPSTVKGRYVNTLTEEDFSYCD